MDFTGKRILLAAHALRGFTGSEIHVSELATFFRDQEASVTCLAMELGDPMASELRVQGVKVINHWQLSREVREFDLVWSHHETIFLWLHLVHRVRARRHLHGLLSWQQKIERVPLIPRHLENGNLRFVANATETRDAAARKSGRNDITVMPNFVPAPFARTFRGTLPEKPERIAVVSNHVPAEVLEASELLEQRGFAVTIFGMGHTYTRLNETTLLGFDIVITIGKTVQYGLTQGIPVFVYDRFGGPGYIHPVDIDAHAAQNFSGRSEPRRLTAEEICRDLVDGYPAACENVEQLRIQHAPAFSIAACAKQAIGSFDEDANPALTSTERFTTLRNHLLGRPQPLVRMIAPESVAAVTSLQARLKRNAA